MEWGMFDQNDHLDSQNMICPGCITGKEVPD